MKDDAISTIETVMSDDSTTTLLCTGDVHIGRRPSRLPTTVDSRRFAARAALDKVVEAALQRDVHAVVLTGDIVDRENRYYEALGPLERGLRRLSEEGIQTFAVAGNHDFDVFPELIHSLGIDGLHLLGPQGTWTREPLILDGETEPRLYLQGWSFPRQRFPRSPLESFEYRELDAPVLGVLHAEVDPGTRCHYAPIQSSELARAGPTLWLLGHQHAPSLMETETGVRYLHAGSPQPLAADETGPHGPWLVRVSPGGEVHAEQVVTATFRYEELDVDLTDVSEEHEARTRLHERIREALRTDLEGLGPVEHLVCRLTLEGRTSLHRSLAEITAGAADDLEITLDGTTATIDRIRNRTRPAIDLDALADARSPAGELARVVRALDEGEETEEIQALLSKAREKVRAVDRSTTYAPVFDHQEDLEPVERADIGGLVRRQALLLIEELEAQKATERS